MQMKCNTFFEWKADIVDDHTLINYSCYSVEHISTMLLDMHK
eukprot:13023.XXX_504161_504286_1 [CDS] Oithona nana genome sequencing.